MSDSRNPVAQRVVDNVLNEMYQYEKNLLQSYTELNTKAEHQNIMSFMQARYPEMYALLKQMADIAQDLQQQYPDSFLSKTVSEDGKTYRYEINEAAYIEYLKKTENLMAISLSFNEDYGVLMSAAQNRYLVENPDKTNEFTAFSQIPIKASQKTTRNVDLVTSAANFVSKQIEREEETPKANSTTVLRDLTDLQDRLQSALSAASFLATKYAKNKTVDTNTEIINVFVNELNEYCLKVRREGRSDKNIEKVSKMFEELNKLKLNKAPLQAVLGYLQEQKKSRWQAMISSTGELSIILDAATKKIEAAIPNVKPVVSDMRESDLSSSGEIKTPDTQSSALSEDSSEIDDVEVIGPKQQASEKSEFDTYSSISTEAVAPLSRLQQLQAMLYEMNPELKPAAKASVPEPTAKAPDPQPSAMQPPPSLFTPAMSAKPEPPKPVQLPSSSPKVQTPAGMAHEQVRNNFSAYLKTVLTSFNGYKGDTHKTEQDNLMRKVMNLVANLKSNPMIDVVAAKALLLNDMQSQLAEINKNKRWYQPEGNYSKLLKTQIENLSNYTGMHLDAANLGTTKQMMQQMNVDPAVAKAAAVKQELPAPMAPPPSLVTPPSTQTVKAEQTPPNLDEPKRRGP